MQLLRFLPFAIISLSLSACIFEKDSSSSDNEALGDKSGIQPIKELEGDKTLATDSYYVPQHGDQSMDFVLMAIYENGALVAQDSYYSIADFSHVNELPNQFGYQHTEVGPYIKAEGSKKGSDGQVELTSVVYKTLTTPYELLISHDVNDHRYSIAEFNQQTKTSNHGANDGLMTQDETLTYTGDKQLFDEYTGNRIGTEASITKMTTQDVETITIHSGTYTVAKTSYQTDITTTIHNSLSDSWTQNLQGFMWFDINTGTILKTSATGTFVRADYPNRILNTVYNSEFHSSDAFPTATVNATYITAKNSDKALKTISLKVIIKNTEILTEKISNKISSISSPMKISL